MTEVHVDACVQMYMRGKGLLRNMGALHNKIRVATLERGVVITANWEKVMYTHTSNRVIGVSKHMTLQDTLAGGADIAHPNSADNVLRHLDQIHRCNTPVDLSQVMGVDTELDASSHAGREKNGPSYVSLACATSTVRAARS